VNTPYDDLFYDSQEDESLRSANVVARLITDTLQPTSIVDVGCGVGTWLSVFEQLGCNDVLGLDGAYVNRQRLRISKAKFQEMDLSRNCVLDRRFDIALSVEVAEHLDSSIADNFVAMLCQLSDVVVFSAAAPHQGGTHHVNEQWPSWWSERFRALGYVACDVLRPRLWGDSRIAYYYQQNLMIFTHQNATNRVMAALPPAPWPVGASMIHPEKWIAVHEADGLSTSTIVRLLGPALLRAFRWRMALLWRRKQP
jgi:SAM-dependent methyltransferase